MEKPPTNIFFSLCDGFVIFASLCPVIFEIYYIIEKKKTVFEYFIEARFNHAKDAIRFAKAKIKAETDRNEEKKPLGLFK